MKFRIQESQDEVKLDALDRKLLTELSLDCRIPINTLAKKVRSSRDVVTYRMRRLEEKGVILRYYPRIAYERLGMSVFRVFFVIDEKDAEKQKSFLRALVDHDHTLSVMEYSDQWDIEWTLLASSLQAFDQILDKVLAKHATIIIEKSRLARIAKYPSAQLPFSKMSKPRDGQLRRIAPAVADVDEVDMSILSQLAKDARQSTYDIAKKVDRSPDSIRLRIKGLMKKGVITSMSILPNYDALGYNWYTFAMRFDYFDKRQESALGEYIRSQPLVLRGSKALGGWDILLAIIARSPKDLHKVVKEIKSQFSSTIRHYATFVACKEHIYNPFPPCLGGVRA